MRRPRPSTAREAGPDRSCDRILRAAVLDKCAAFVQHIMERAVIELRSFERAETDLADVPSVPVRRIEYQSVHRDEQRARVVVGARAR